MMASKNGDPNLAADDNLLDDDFLNGDTPLGLLNSNSEVFEQRVLGAD